jgi:D-inositol-3-phosphate glycosyltransferase
MVRSVALISEHASPLSLLGGVDSGGQNVYVAQLARHLGRLGVAVDVFTRRDSQALPNIVSLDDGVRVIHVPAGPAEYVRKEELLPHMAEFTDFMLWFMNSPQSDRRVYDLLHANFWMSGLVAADLKRATGIPFAITFHALGRVRRQYQRSADGFPDERFAIEDRLVAEADAIVAECPQDEQDLRQLYHADPARIKVIPCGFDPGEFWRVDRGQARAELGIEPNERLILQVGRMVPRKGVDTVVRGLARLVYGQGIPARLLIVGGESDDPDPALTPEIGRLLQVAEEEQIRDRVMFAGRKDRDRLKYYYSAADVFVTMPWYEPFGITPLEAMACGTPVIGANVGGVKYSIANGETGYLVPANDADALAERLAYLFRNPSLLHVLGQQALVRAREQFTWERIARLMTDLYSEVAVRAPGPARGATGAAWQSRPEKLAADQSGEVIPGLAVIERSFLEAQAVLNQSRRELPASIAAAAEALHACLAQGGKVLVCGNGGSAADAQHFAAELVGRFKLAGRPALPVLALNTDSSILTAWSNDVGFDLVFARQIEAFGHANDVLVGISTSGRSRNIVQAFAVAHALGMRTLAVTGGDGGDMAELADLQLLVPSNDTPRIQEIHILLLHMLCELVENRYTVPATGPAWLMQPVAMTE